MQTNILSVDNQCNYPNSFQRTMKQQLLIRDETKTDIPAITEVTIAAFKTLGISNNTEQHIIEALRAAGTLNVILAAAVLHHFFIGIPSTAL